MMDRDAHHQLEEKLRQIEHVFNSISLRSEAETTPPATLGGLADAGFSLARAAGDELRAAETSAPQTEYTDNAATH